MTPTDLTPAPNVYDRLCALIFAGEIPPGKQLVERELAQRLGVSRIPIRESLQRLVAEGILVGGEKWQGVRVRNYTPREIQQLYEYRASIEAGAAGLAATTATDADIARLEKACDDLKPIVANYGSARWAEADHDFHYALVAASHNDRMIQAQRLLLAECHYVFFIFPANTRQPVPTASEIEGRMNEVVEHHREIVRSVGQGNAEAAERLVRKHLHLSAADLASSLRSPAQPVNLHPLGAPS